MKTLKAIVHAKLEVPAYCDFGNCCFLYKLLVYKPLHAHINQMLGRGSADREGQEGVQATGKECVEERKGQHFKLG